ncbi:tail fiber assembly protein [Paraburkholderia dilworthii]|uniref:tail fiber assembly protein n=1 Tax=Paraburkholderia dilworthii TaxID=948106 RepID=UPI0009FF3253
MLAPHNRFVDNKTQCTVAPPVCTHPGRQSEHPVITGKFTSRPALPIDALARLRRKLVGVAFQNPSTSILSRACATGLTAFRSTDAELSPLKQWEEYRVAVSRADLTVCSLVWPSEPQ